MLADVFHIRGLCKKLVDLVADTEFLVVLEVTPGQFLLDASEDLEGASILCLPCLGRDGFLSIEDAASLEDGRSAVSREVAGLYAVFEIDTFNDGLAAFSGK